MFEPFVPPYKRATELVSELFLSIFAFAPEDKQEYNYYRNDNEYDNIDQIEFEWIRLSVRNSTRGLSQNLTGGKQEHSQEEKFS